MYTDEQILGTIRASLKAVTGKPESEFTPDTTIVADLQLESIDTIDLLFKIEKSLGLSINLADIFQSRRREHGQKAQFDVSVRDIAGYIRESLNK